MECRSCFISFVMDQGVSYETANDLYDRKLHSPRLTGVSIGGKWISLCPASGVKFDEMVSSGVPPQAKTDVEFLKGHANGSQFQRQPKHGDRLRAKAEKAGVNTKGKVYLGQLARFQGDPEAWIGGRGDAQEVLSKRGWGSDGLVDVKPREPSTEPEKAVDVADKIVTRETIKELVGQRVSGREFRDRKEKVKARLTPSWKKKK